MKTKHIKSNFLELFLISIIAIITLTLTSYKFFMSNFEQLEKDQNIKNIHSILSQMDKDLNYIEDITADYALWDDTYNFIKTKNNHYIYENFRAGTSTLEDLELDFMIFTDLRNRKIFSKYTEKDIYKKNSLFEKDILTKFENINDLATIHEQKNKILKLSSNYFYIVKKYISNSDSSVPTNGFIYSGRLITNDILNDMTEVFDEVSIKNKTYSNNDVLINSDYLKNSKIKIEEDTEGNYLINTMQLYNYKSQYVLSIETKTKRNLIKKGKETVFYYNIAISFFLILIFFLIFRNRKVLENYSQVLESEVNEKTKELQKSNSQLKILSEQDELTKINNRRNYFILGEKSIKKAIANNSDFSVLMIDLDDFKKVNDTYGHDVGDKVLIEFCNVVNSQLNENHIFGRLGGEEFSIIFTDITEEEAYELSEKIRIAVEKSKLYVNGKNIDYTVSLGLTKRNNLSSLDKILKNADELLYDAKNRGKNCIIRDR